jgi:hypothetical protein
MKLRIGMLIFNIEVISHVSALFPFLFLTFVAESVFSIFFSVFLIQIIFSLREYRWVQNSAPNATEFHRNC